MEKSKKSYDRLKQEFLHEMEYISNVGNKLFICPFKGRSKLSIKCYYFTYGLIVVTATQLFLTLCVTGFTNWFELINISPNLGVCLMILIQYRKVHTNRDLYDEIYQHFRQHLWEAIDDSDSHKKILDNYTQATKYIVRFQYYYTVGLAIVVGFSPRIIMYYENDVLCKEKTYLYPFDGWYPFDKHKWYYIAYIWESCMTTIVIFVYVFVNMIHISYTRYICMELKILGNSVENLISEKDVTNLKDKKKSQQTHYSIRKKLKFIIAKHQYLAKITSDLENVLGDGMLLTYVFGSVFICLTAFTATVVDSLYMSLRYFSFFCSLLFEIFVQCIMGQLLINHSEKFEKSIYSADWPNADYQTKKMLIVFLARTQKAFIFTAKGYLVMNLDTFSGICSLSYQYFNLLRTTYSK